MESMSWPLTPKSHSLISPRELTRMLDGFTSRCMIWCFSRRYARPRRTAMLTLPRISSGILLASFNTWSREPPSMCYMQMLISPSL